MYQWNVVMKHIPFSLWIFPAFDLSYIGYPTATIDYQRVYLQFDGWYTTYNNLSLNVLLANIIYNV